MASIIFRPRHIRRRNDSEDDAFTIDWSKGPQHNLKEILINIASKASTSKEHKLSYLNFFTMFCNQINQEYIDKLGYSYDEIFCCLRVALFHKTVEVRASGYRAIRYCLKSDNAVDSLYRINLHYFIARSIDIDFNNKPERIQSLKLVRKLISLKPSKIPGALIRCLVAIAKDGLLLEEKDLLVRSCWATLAEMIVLNPKASSEAGAISAILDSILTGNQPHNISEALVNSVLFLLNSPDLRNLLRSEMNLQQFVAPFTDYFLPFINNQRTHDTLHESKDIAAKNALLSILRSWPGLVFLSKSHDTDSGYLNGLRSLFEMLHLPYFENGKHLMELIFEVFYLPVPIWSNDFQKALMSCTCASNHDSWNLYNGFIASEGRHLLPYLAKHRQNLLDNYLSLILYTFITYGLLDGLVSMIISPNNREIAVRATILLGELLHLSSQLLPHEVSQRCHSLPRLLDTAISPLSSAEQRNVASAAISCLNHMHSIKKHTLINCSVYLDQLLQFCHPSYRQSSDNFSTNKTKLRQYIRKDSEAPASITISQVLNCDPVDWNWNIVGCILKSPSEGLKKFEENNHKLFIRKLINYYKPSSKNFAQMSNGDNNNQVICLTGCYLIDFLLDAEENKSMEFLNDFLLDLGNCLSQIAVENPPSSALMSSTRILSTWTHYYFLYIGRLSSSSKGRKLLEKAGIFQYMLDLVSLSSHEVYLKLIISILNYSEEESFSRTLLIKVLTCNLESARIYATNYLRVLMRAEIADFRKWALELLIQQLNDKSHSVVLAAIDILDEACDSIENLEALIALRPSLLHIGDKGLLLSIRYLSTPSGFKFFRDSNMLTAELERWKKYFNFKYVRIVEDLLNDTLSYHQRSEDGTYGRRTDKKSTYKKTAFIPPHLYGELAKYEEGLNLLYQENHLGPMCETIRKNCASDELSVLQLKAALWAIGSVGSSAFGFHCIAETEIIPNIIQLAAESPFLSIRGTCFFVIGLLSSTEDGADYLKEFCWETVRHSRTDKWPISQKIISTFVGNVYSSRGKRDYSWSMSSYGAQTTDIFCMLSGKKKGFNSADSFIFNENQEETEDMLYCSLPASHLNKGASTLSSQIGFKSPNILLRESESQNMSEMNARPRSSSDGHHSIESRDERDDRSGLWLKDDVIKQSQESRGSVTNINDANIVRKGMDSLDNASGVRSTLALYPSAGSDSKKKLSPNSLISDPKRKISEPCGHIVVSKGIDNLEKSRSGSYTESTSGVSSYDSFAYQVITDNENFNNTNKGKKSSPLSNATALILTPKHSSPNFSSFASQNSNSISSNISGSSSPDLFSSYLSAKDALGYVTLLQINKKRGESLGVQKKSVLGIGNFDGKDSDEDSDSGYRLSSSKFLSVKTRLEDIKSISSPGSVETKYYMGICLPTNLSLIFSDPDENIRLNRSNQSNQTKSHPYSSLKSHMDKMSNDLIFCRNGLELHNKSNCLYCSQPKELCFQSGSESRERASISKSENSVSSQTLAVPTYVSRTDIFDNYSSSFTNSSPEIGPINFKGNEEINPDYIKIRKEIFKFITNLSNAAAEQGLLNLKQKYPLAFQDICLYSEVSLHLASYTYSLPARRFLQELFLDLNFDSLYPNIEAISARKIDDTNNVCKIKAETS